MLSEYCPICGAPAGEGCQPPGDNPHVIEDESKKAVSDAMVDQARTVELRSGGRIVLTLKANLFSLGSDERAFVVSLIEECDAYEGSATTTEDR